MERPSNEEHERAMESVIERERGAGKPSLTQLFYLKCCVEDKQLFPARLSECSGRQLSEEERESETDNSILRPWSAPLKSSDYLTSPTLSFRLCK